jgi:hypothetical protein
VSNALLGPIKRWKRRVCRYPTPYDTPSDSDTELAVSLSDDSTEEDEEQDADCVFCTGGFSEDYNGEEWIRCAICTVLGGRTHTVCWYGATFFFVRIFTDKHCFVLSLYALQLHFF